MLTDEERREIEEALGSCGDRRGACVDALKVIQKHRGWVSDEAVNDLVPVLGMSAEEIDAVATFYPLIFRKPVGRHVIFVCDGVSCWVMGYEGLLAALTDRLGIAVGGTTEDRRFTLLPISCIGACDHAPAIMVDGDLYGDVSPESLGEILEKYG